MTLYSNNLSYEEANRILKIAVKLSKLTVKSMAEAIGVDRFNLYHWKENKKNLTHKNYDALFEHLRKNDPEALSNACLICGFPVVFK